jgi:2-polyprenyl-3-methyl-5-hydroxy-6-metoxy-1,4-benzoquinol methylase
MVRKFDKYERRGAYHWGWYKVNFGKYRDVTRMAVKQFPEEGTLLDLGCGDGLTTYLLHMRGLTVTGTDLSRAGIKLAQRETKRRNVKIDFRVQDFSKTTGEYDYVLCHAVIEHVEDYRGMLRKIKSVVKEYAIISTANGDKQKGDSYDCNIWTPKEFEKILKAAGFVIKKIYHDDVLIYYKIKPARAK